jgi:hypothetical protein
MDLRLSFARALVVAALLLAPQAVRAGPVCGGSTFTTCASVTVRKILLANGNIRVRFEVMNQAGLGNTHGGTRFTYIGLSDLPDSAAYVDRSLFVGGSAEESDWEIAKPRKSDAENPHGLKLREDMRGVRLREGVLEGLSAGEVAAFEFELSGVAFDDVNVENWEIRAEAVGVECSTDLVAKNGTLNEARSTTALCAAAVVTPEPATLVLLATGLAAIGGAAARRRRSHRVFP